MLIDSIPLSKEQEHFISPIPAGAIVHIRPFDARTREAAARLEVNLKTALPHALILHLGGTRLGIAGEQAIDIVAIDDKNFKTSVAATESFFGMPEIDASEDGVLRWKMEHGGFPVHLYLAPTMTPRLREAYDVQRLLEARGDLRAEYEKLKRSYDGKFARDYARAKFAFFNNALHPQHS